MKAVPAKYRGDRLVELTEDLPLAEDAVVLVVIPDGGDDSEAMWPRLVASQFLKGYSEADAVYDSIEHGALSDG